jgi:hypothetical protein
MAAATRAARRLIPLPMATLIAPAAWRSIATTWGALWRVPAAPRRVHRPAPPAGRCLCAAPPSDTSLLSQTLRPIKKPLPESTILSRGHQPSKRWLQANPIAFGQSVKQRGTCVKSREVATPPGTRLTFRAPSPRAKNFNFPGVHDTISHYRRARQPAHPRAEA